MLALVVTSSGGHFWLREPARLEPGHIIVAWQTSHEFTTFSAGKRSGFCQVGKKIIERYEKIVDRGHRRA